MLFVLLEAEVRKLDIPDGARLPELKEKKLKVRILKPTGDLLPKHLSIAPTLSLSLTSLIAIGGGQNHG